MNSVAVKWIERLALCASIPLFLLMWQFASTSGLVNELLFPPPTAVAAALWDEFANGTLMLDLGMSTMRVAVGFLTGAAVAILIGPAVTPSSPTFSHPFSNCCGRFRPSPLYPSSSSGLASLPCGLSSGLDSTCWIGATGGSEHFSSPADSPSAWAVCCCAI